MHRPAALLMLMLAAAPAAVAQDAPVRLELVTRIGCFECAGPTMLTRVHDIAMAGGRVYVLDGSDPHVRVFDDQGRPVRAFGRPGGGPGEFRFPTRLLVRAAGDVEVFDFGLGRFSRFDSLGTSLTTRTVNLGQFPGLAGRADNPATYIVASELRDAVQQLMRLADHEAAATRLPGPAATFPVDQRTRTVSRPVLAARPGTGVAAGEGRDEYRIRVLNEDGSLVHEIVRDVARIRKTSAELAADRALQARLRQGMAEMMRRDDIPAPPISEFRRQFSAMEYDDDGRLWVRTRRGDPDTTVFDLFDAGGKYLGEVRVPGQLGAFTLAGGRLAAAVTHDEVPHVVIWRVR